MQDQLKYGTRAPESFDEFTEGAEQHYRVMLTEIPDYRRGQAYYNYCALWFAEIADEVNGTPVDPFYQDTRVNSFLAAVRPYFE